MNAPLNTAESQDNNTTESAGSPKKKIILGVLALAAVGYLGHSLWLSHNYVETDNAQVAGHIIPVLPKIGGFVKEVRVVENQNVKAGDVLVAIDDRDYRSKLEQADAELANLISSVGSKGQTGQAVAQIQTAEAQAQAAESAVRQAEADNEKAQKELERLKPLLAQKVISPQQFDITEAAARAAQAKLQAARDSARAASQQITVYSAALRGADARLRAAKAARDIAAHQLEDTLIRAARDGVVTHKSVEVGQLVQTGQPVMNVVPLDDVWVVANLKETQIRDIHTGSAVEIRVDAYPGSVWQGQVESFSPATGSKFALLPPDNATGNFTKVVQRVPVKIRVTPGKNPQEILRPGMSVLVTIRKTGA